MAEETFPASIAGCSGRCIAFVSKLRQRVGTIDLLGLLQVEGPMDHPIL
jgi:hypothetical protein